MEDVEFNESRSPNDVDVVTCFHLPHGYDQFTFWNTHKRLFKNKLMKRAFKVDSYYIPLGEPATALSIKGTNYWYSMWSHTRAGIWKGFVEVELDTGLDALAMDILTGLDGGEAVA